MIKENKLQLKYFFENSKKNILISKERKELLLHIANTITYELNERKELNINFICTHNSRRSQISQAWAFYAADYFNLNINAFSGGTEVTSFHRNSVKTLQEVGFKFNIIKFSHKNPKYTINFKGSNKTIFGFSKKYDDPENKHPYISITTCKNAKENCPFIPDAIHSFHLPFTDPKHSDKTTTQKQTYLEINQLIACEIFIIFEEIKKQL